MSWFTREIKDLKVIDELEKSSDRAVAVIAGALVDSELSNLIRTDLHLDDTNYSKKVRKEVFHPEGPLGNFGPRINLAYLMGYFSQDSHTDLLNLKNIRN